MVSGAILAGLRWVAFQVFRVRLVFTTYDACFGIQFLNVGFLVSLALWGGNARGSPSLRLELRRRFALATLWQRCRLPRFGRSRASLSVLSECPSVNVHFIILCGRVPRWVTVA